MNRRAFLGMGGVVALSGMAGCSTVFGKTPEAKTIATLPTFREPVIKSGTSRFGVGPLYATVVTSKEDADARMNWDAFKSPPYSEDYHPHLDDWQGIDYDQYFISIFLAQFSTVPRDRDSIRPDEHFVDETLVFTLDGGSWPLSRTTGVIWPRKGQSSSTETEIYTYLIKWKRNSSPPTDATVRLTYADN